MMCQVCRKEGVSRYRKGGGSSIDSRRQGIRSSPCDVERCGLFKIRALHSVLETAIVRKMLMS